MIAGPALADLAGKVAVVTGAASGLGRGMAAAYARAGMKVVLADIRADALDATVAALGAEGLDVSGAACDVRDRAQVEALRDEALDRHGAVHVVTNNAGVIVVKPAWELTADDWRWVLGVNLDGVINGVSVFVPTLLAQGEPAHVVNTSSMAGFVSLAGLAAYTVSKRGVVGLSEVLALDLEAAEAPIGVSVVCPGFVMTQLGNAGTHRPTDVGGPEGPGRDLADDTAEIDRVAGIVVDAIRTGRRYVFTHPERNDQIRARFDRVLEDG